MKKQLFRIALTLGAGICLLGCVDQPAKTTATTDPTQRTYDRNDLHNSGRQTTGEAVQKLDPAAQVNTGR